MKEAQQNKRTRRHRRIRSRIVGTAARPRLSVFRSGKHIIAQLIDDGSEKTVVLVSDLGKITLASAEGKGGRRVGVAFTIGKALAAKAKEKGITHIVFDRGGYAYHGRVKAVADGAREGGLNF